MRHVRDLAIGVVGGLICAQIASYAANGHAILWAAIGGGVLVLCLVLGVERLLARRQIAYGIRPGAMVVRLSTSAHGSVVSIDVQLPLRNVTDLVMRYRVARMTVRIGDFDSPLSEPFGGLIPPKDETAAVRHPISLASLPVATADSEAEISLEWLLYYGPDRRRFSFRRAVGAMYTMALPLADGLQKGEQRKVEQTVRFSKVQPDRILDYRERRKLSHAA